MKTSDIMMRELNNDLSLIKIWLREKENSITEEEIEYYKGCIARSRYKADAKEELIQSLGYTILFTEDRTECISIYPIELDD